MKIAVLLDNCSTGGYKWVMAVFGSIKKYYPEIKIHLFYSCKKDNLPSGVLELTQNSGLEMKKTKFFVNTFHFKKKKKFPIPFINDCINNIREINARYKFKRKCKEVENFSKYISSNYDVVFDAWPYNHDAYKFSIPSFCVPHDFILTHFFGFHSANWYNHKACSALVNRIKTYLEKNYVPIVSSDFIKSEIRRLYPEYKGEIHSIMISQMSKMERLEEAKSKKILQKYNISGDYILVATNNAYHKNTGAVLTAYYHIKQKYSNLKLIIIGYGTEEVLLNVNTPYYGDTICDEKNGYDVKGVGLVSEEELVAIMQNAKLLLNTSLCEAACGSGLDAWAIGTPTAISNIPCFIEQIEKLGVKSEIFDPKNCTDIANACLRLLDNPEYAKENARISKERINSTELLKDFASQYVNVFSKAIDERKVLQND